MDLYLLIERGYYQDFLENVNQDSKLSTLEKKYLMACYYVKINDRKKYKQISLDEEDIKGDNIDRFVIQIKGLSFLIFEGEENEIKKNIENLEFYFNSEQKFTDIVYRIAQAEYHHYVAIYHFMIGEFNEAEHWFEKAINLDEEIDIPIRVAKVKNNFALMKAGRGEIVKAQSINFEVEKLWVQTESTHNLGQLYGNISELYEIRGMYDSALYYAKKAEDILKKIDNELEQMLIKYTIFKILRKSQIKKTKHLDQLFLELKGQLQSEKQLLQHQETSGVLMELVTYATYYARESIDELFDLFDDLLAFTQNASYVKYRYDLAQGIYLSKGGRFKDKYHAQKIFSRFKELEDADFYVNSTAILYQIDLYLFEYQTTRDKNILNELFDLQNSFAQIIQNKNSLKLELDNYLLKIQLAAYQNKKNQIFKLFHMAIMVAIENGLNQYYSVLYNYYTQFKVEYDKNRELNNWDLIRSISQLPNVKQEASEIEIKDILLFDQFNNTFSVINQKKLDQNTLTIEEINKFSGSYYSTSNYPDEIILNKVGSFPWVGLVFDRNFERAINILEYVTNSIKWAMVNLEQEPTVRRIINAPEVKDIINDILGSKLPQLSHYLPKSEFTKLQNYKLLLHPMRLAIMDVLKRTFSMPRKDLENTIDGNRGTFASHLTKLIDEELLQSNTQFIKEEPLMVINITNKGLAYYQEFKSIIQNV